MSKINENEDVMRGQKFIALGTGMNFLLVNPDNILKVYIAEMKNSELYCVKVAYIGGISEIYYKDDYDECFEWILNNFTWLNPNDFRRLTDD